MDIEDIIGAIKNHRVKITDHADEEAIADKLQYEEIYFSVIRGKLRKQEFSHFRTLGQPFTVENDWPNKAIQPSA